MDPRNHRTPSPGNVLQHGYQLDDNPHGHQPMGQNLDVHNAPMGRYSPGDTLDLHPAVGQLCVILSSMSLMYAHN